MNLQKNSLLLLLLLLLFSVSCSSSRKLGAGNSSPAASTNTDYRPQLANDATFLLLEVSEDKSYGYSQKNPIKVGGNENREGPLNERRFLNALAGPNGEPISYERLGSCCEFDTPNGFMGSGMLDRYEIRWEGQEKPFILYLNMYDYDVLKAPLGLSIIP